MVTDPARCPIPPGFEVIGNFNDDFEDFKDTTSYSSFEDGSGIVHGLNFGFSNRWKNPKMEKTNIVCGFQFRIGPDIGTRWNAIQQSLGQVNEGTLEGFEVECPWHGSKFDVRTLQPTKPLSYPNHKMKRYLTKQVHRFQVSLCCCPTWFHSRLCLIAV